MKKPKPSITVDERGVILHLTNDAGEGFAVELSPSTIVEMGAQLAKAKAALVTPEGKRTIVKALGSLFQELVKTQPKEDDGASKPDD